MRALLKTHGLCQQWPNGRRPVLWPIEAAFWSLSKFICRPSTINNPSCDSIVWIKLPLRRSLL